MIGAAQAPHLTMPKLQKSHNAAVVIAVVDG